MTNVLDWLRVGDLRSDGMSNEVAAFILEHNEMFDDLLAGIDDQDPVVRARTADVLEKIGRQRPDLIHPALPALTAAARRKEAAVKMHLAMLFGHLTIDEELRADLYALLRHMLEEPGVFTRSWAIASLCILARQEPAYQPEILNRIGRLATDPSIAIRTRARKAISLLIDSSAPFPPGWVKSHHLSQL